MTATLLFVLIALVLLAVFITFATHRTRELPDVDQAVTAIQSLDIEASRNLVDPEEEAFLRARLPPQEFRRIKRERARAALAYVQFRSHASLQFARFGDAAQRSPDPAIAASGRQIANSAIYLRLRALRCECTSDLVGDLPQLRSTPFAFSA
jgi:hypothetical protein